jgi:hypothetical protein
MLNQLFDLINLGAEKFATVFVCRAKSNQSKINKKRFSCCFLAGDGINCSSFAYEMLSCAFGKVLFEVPEKVFVNRIPLLLSFLLCESEKRLTQAKSLQLV